MPTISGFDVLLLSRCLRLHISTVSDVRKIQSGAECARETEIRLRSERTDRQLRQELPSSKPSATTEPPPLMPRE